jgi:hypothetical protein
MANIVTASAAMLRACCVRTISDLREQKLAEVAACRSCSCGNLEHALISNKEKESLAEKTHYMQQTCVLNLI